jgi:hypothetical protein
MSKTALKLDLRVGEAVTFDGGRITITLLDKSGQRARLDIKADEGVKIGTPRIAMAAEQAKKGLTLN